MINGQRHEYGSSLYKFISNGQTYWSYNKPNEGGGFNGAKYQVEWNKNIPKGATLAGVIHNHPIGGWSEFGGNLNDFQIGMDMMTTKSKVMLEQ